MRIMTDEERADRDRRLLAQRALAVAAERFQMIFATSLAQSLTPQLKDDFAIAWAEMSAPREGDDLFDFIEGDDHAALMNLGIVCEQAPRRE